MKKWVANLLVPIAERRILASAALNRLEAATSIFRFRNVLSDKALNYHEFSKPMNLSPPTNQDIGFAYLVRVMLERKYDTIIEIGATDGSRILHLKRLFPEIDAYGLDIIREYETLREVDGVRFEKFDLEFFRPGRFSSALVVCIGTLPYFKPDELASFFTTIHNAGIEICFVELACRFAETRSLRRSHVSYYHPYSHLLKQAGFQVADRQPNHNVSLSMIERCVYIHATMGEQILLNEATGT